MIKTSLKELLQIESSVALGTVGWTINDLKAQGIVVRNGTEKRIDDFKWLINTWIETYPLKLRVKHFVGGFIAEDPFWWEEIEILDMGAQWGGETAAAITTKYLKPQITTIYTRAPIGKLVQAGRLKKAARQEDVNVAILRPFWKNDEAGEMVHPIVVYADLVGTGDVRNLKVAQRIYEEFIRQYIK